MLAGVETSEHARNCVLNKPVAAGASGVGIAMGVSYESHDARVVDVRRWSGECGRGRDDRRSGRLAGGLREELRRPSARIFLTVSAEHHTVRRTRSSLPTACCS
jgi:hypothetical protein